ncbi:hypothetical protein NS274_04110 [Pseudomonas oryzihabitans]|nr:hypothetical protein NS274_04110 [Pseudomonas psychrotolerans]
MKTREWLYIIFIVILLQFIIQAAAWLYGGNSGALNYISFAGTIVSIILAVLAIVYSFVQSISQQTSSEKISNQVEKLINVTNKIETSKEGLSDAVKHLSNMAQKLDESIAHQGQIKVQVDNIAAKFDASMRHGSLSKDYQHGDTEDIGKPFSAGYTGLIVQSLYLYYGNKLEISLNDTLENLIMPILYKFTEVKKGNIRSFKNYNEGLFLGVWQALAANDYIIITNENNMNYELSEHFKAQCQKFIETEKSELDEGNQSPRDDLVARIISECEHMLEAALQHDSNS